MKTLKKIVSFLCVAAVLLSGIHIVTANESVADYVWIEAENMDASSNYKSTTSYSSASGSMAATLRNVSPTGNENYHADYTFNITEEGTYDIWVLSTRPDLTWVSDFAYKINGGEANYCINSGKNIGYVGNQNNSSYQPEQLYTTHSALGSASMVWNKMPSATLSANQYIISICPEQRGLGGYIFAMDVIAIVPSYCNWTPTDATTKPAVPNSDYSLINAPVFLRGAYDINYFDYPFTAKDSDIYDIWVLGNRPDLSWISDYNLTLDDGTAFYGNYSGKNLSTGYQGNANNSAYKPIAVNEIPTFGAISWHKFPSQIISKGDHNLRLTIDKRSQGDYLANISKIAIVPQNWQWIPGDENSVPVKAEHNSMWLEAEHFSVNNKGDMNGSNGYGFNVTLADGSSSNSSGTPILMSNRYYLKQFYRATDAAYTEAPELTYNFRPSKSGVYDMYIVSSGAGEGHVSHYEYSLNGSDYIYAKQAGGYESSGGHATYDNTTNLKWNKIPNVKLSSYGVNTLKFRSKDLRTNGDIYLCMFDFIAFVPVGTGILPASFNNDYPKRLADFEAATLGIDASMLRNDITLPKTTPTGASVNWATNNSSVITAAGKIGHNTGKVGNATLTATVSRTIGNFSGTGSKNYAVTVIPDLYAYDVELTYADGSTVKSILRDNEIVNGNATFLNSNGNHSAVVFLAYYTKNGRLSHVGKSEVADIPEGKSLELSASIPLPSDADGGIVKMFVWSGNMIPLADTTEYKDASVIARVSGVELPETIEGGQTYSSKINVVTGKTLDFDSELSLTLWKDKELWGVIETDAVIPTGSYFAGENIESEFEFTVSDGIPSGEYELRVQLNKLDTKMAEDITIDLDNDLNYDAAYKPMSYGTYIARKTGLYHFWYVNQANTLIWDGEPYVPIGGMSLFKYLDNYSPTDPAGNDAVFAVDVAMLEEFKAQGVTDLYINPSNYGPNIPMEAWQRLVDKLEEMGFNYGIQLNERQNGGKPLTSYYVRAGGENTSNVRVTGIREGGTVSVTIKPEDFTTIQFSPKIVGAKYIVINETTSIHVKSGDADVKDNGDGTYTLSAEVPKLTYDSCMIAFTPKIYSEQGRAWSNYIDYDNESYERVAKFADALEMGDGFRLWVDLCYNETGVHNDAESARFVSDNTNAEYAEWLEQKYGTIDALNDAWLTRPAMQSFGEASQIIPLYTSPKDSNGAYYTYFVLDSTNRVYQVDTFNGLAWTDFWYFKCDKFLEFSNKLADEVKQYNDAPVVYKEASVYSEYFVNTATYGGFDGMGAEAYGSLGDARGKQSFAYGEAENASKTMWSIVTETETDSDIVRKYESDVHGYESEAYMHSHFDNLMNGGSKGIFDFLLNGHTSVYIHEGYSYVANPRMYPWLKSYNEKVHTEEYIEKLKSDETLERVDFYYPAINNYWTKPNWRTAVGYPSDMSNHNIGSTDSGNHVAPASNPLVDTKLLITYMATKPETKLFGAKLEEAIRENRDGKNIVFFGFRQNIGDLPEIDKYYTNEYVTENGVEKQILKAVDGAEVIYTTSNGKPWAIKKGNLYIVAADNWLSGGRVKYISDLGL